MGITTRFEASIYVDDHTTYYYPAKVSSDFAPNQFEVFLVSLSKTLDEYDMNNAIVTVNGDVDGEENV